MSAAVLDHAMPFPLAVAGSDAPLAAGKVVCIGKNYVDHAREMGGEPPAEPMFFFKPSTSLVASGGRILIPRGVENVHHEAELAVIIGRTATRVRAADAMDHVFGYAACLDMTARDLQARAKKAGQPWSLAKGMDTFCPIGTVIPREQVTDPHALGIRLDVNGTTRQSGTTADMVHRIEALIAHITRYVTLERGDILATGTPAGVAAVVPGDRLTVTIDGVPELTVDVVAEEGRG